MYNTNNYGNVLCTISLERCLLCMTYNNIDWVHYNYISLKYTICLRVGFYYIYNKLLYPCESTYLIIARFQLVGLNVK